MNYLIITIFFVLVFYFIRWDDRKRYCTCCRTKIIHKASLLNDFTVVYKCPVCGETEYIPGNH